MPGEPKAVSTVKHGHFEKKRQEKVKVVTQERVAICNYLSTLKHGGFEDNAMLSSTSKNKASKYVTSDTKVLTVTVKFDPSKSLKSTGPPEAAKSSVNLKSSMLELEMKRFEAMKRRQEKEIRRIVASESKLADLQKKVRGGRRRSHELTTQFFAPLAFSSDISVPKLYPTPLSAYSKPLPARSPKLVKAEHDDIERKKEHHKRVAKARADTVEKKRVREMERKKRDEEELARRRDLAKKDAELEIKKARHERKMEKVRARDAMEREMERRRLLEAQAAKTKAIMDHQIQLAEDSRKKMNAKSERVKQAMERKMELKRLEVEEQRKKAERKIHTVVERNKKIQLDKRAAFNQKQAEIARFKAEKAVEIKKKVEMDSKKREDKHLRQKQKKDEAMGKVRIEEDQNDSKLYRLLIITNNFPLVTTLLAHRRSKIGRARF